MAAKHDGFRDFVLDQLSALPGLTHRAMFGGYGLINAKPSSASSTEADSTSGPIG